MRLSVLFMLLGCLQVTAKGYSQQVSITARNTPLKTIFREIEKQTGFLFLYDKQLLSASKPVSITLRNASIDEALQVCLKDQRLSFNIENNTIVITAAPEIPLPKAPEVVQEPVPLRVTIIDADGTTLPGASITNKNTKKSGVTNTNGIFNIAASRGDVLEVSYIGYDKQTYTVKDARTATIVLSRSKSALNETVVIGYGTSTVKTSTDAVSRVDPRVLQDNAASGVVEIIQGQIPGMLTMLGSGAPGEEPVMITRGVSSLEGALGPLIVVDDIPMAEDFMLTSINPNDITSINVLKGSSAVAIYGSRGAGGVFMITTKSGLTANPSIAYRLNHGIVKLTNPMKVLNSDEFKTLWVESLVNRANDENYVGTGNLFPSIDRYSTYYNTFIRNGFWGEAETDWMDVLYQDAVKTNHNLTVTGNGGGIGYTITSGYTNEIGQIIGSSFKRYNVGLKLDSRSNKLISYGVNFQGTSSNRDEAAVTLNEALLMRPDMPSHNPDGSVFVPPTNSGYRNPLVDIEGTSVAGKNLLYTLAAYLQLNLGKGFTWKTIASMNNNDNERKDYYGANTAIGSNNWSTTAPRRGRGIWTSGHTKKSEFDSRLTYRRTFNRDHNIDVLGAYTFTKNRFYNQRIVIDNFAEDEYLNAIFQGINPSPATGAARGSALTSYIFRTNYNYKNQLMATVSMRRDGTSRMAPSVRFATFPAAALAWNLAEMNWMKTNVPQLNMFKLRASIGKTANAFVPEYGWMTTFDASNYNGAPAIIPKQVPNEDLKWETSTQYDLGIDFNLFKNSRLDGSINYYNKRTRGALNNYALPLSAGLATGNTMANLIDIDNNGIELDLRIGVIKNKTVNWDVSFNVTRNTNKLVRMDIDMKRLSAFAATILKVGQPIGMFYGFRTDGLFRSWDEVAKYEALNAYQPYQALHVAPGEIRLVDKNGNGWVDFGTGTANYTEADKDILGKSFPDLFGGFATQFSWKQFSFGLQGSFSIGAQKNWSVMETQFQFSASNPKNLLKLNMNRWTPDNPDAEYPKMLLAPANSTLAFGRARPLTQHFHNYWIYDASYFRINNARIAYNVPPQVLKRILPVIGSLNAGFSVNNVITFTKYPGVNPEAFNRDDRIAGPAMDNSTYPMTRTYNVNFNISFQQK